MLHTFKDVGRENTKNMFLVLCEKQSDMYVSADKRT